MTPRNRTPPGNPSIAPPGAPSGASPGTAVGPRPPLSTPLVWAGGGVLLTATMWLPSMIALFRAFGSLFH